MEEQERQNSNKAKDMRHLVEPHSNARPWEAANPAPITQPSLIVTPGRMTALAYIMYPRSMTIGLARPRLFGDTVQTL
jgi:hypothetical protein